MKKVIFMIGLLAFAMVGCKQENEDNKNKKPVVVEQPKEEAVFHNPFEPDMSFKVEKGKGLCHYVDYQTAIDIAEQTNRAIYAGRPRKLVSFIDAARDIDTDCIPVWIDKVFPGDTFTRKDGRWTYIPAKRK